MPNDPEKIVLHHKSQHPVYGAKFSVYGRECERLYVEDGRSVEEIHELIGGAVGRHSIYRWAKKYDWQKLRMEFYRSDENDYYTMARDCKLLLTLIDKAIVGGDNPTALIDSHAKLNNSRKTLRAVDMRGASIRVLSELSEWLHLQKENELLEQLKAHVAPFLDWVGGKYTVEELK